MIIGLASWLIKVSLYGSNSYTMCCQPFHRKQCMSYALSHHDNDGQVSVNNLWFSILGDQGIVQIYKFITELLTAFLGKNMTYNWKNTDSKIIDIAYSNTCKQRLLAGECLILIRYYHQTAKTRILYESTDGPTAQPTYIPPNSDRLGDLH